MKRQEGPAADRLQFFDTVRSLAMLCVLLFHAVAAYSTVTPHWSVHDGSSAIADIIRKIFDVFMMPVFFFVAGYFALPSLLKQGARVFVRGKLKRLGIPWVLAVFGIIPLFQYMGRMKGAGAQSRQPFLDYWITYLKGFGTFQTGPLTPDRANQWHYWFLSLLLMFFVTFALLQAVKNRWQRSPVSTGNSVPIRKEGLLKVLLGFGALTAAGYFVVSRFTSESSWVWLGPLLQFQPTHLVFYLAYFGLGFLAYSKEWFGGDNPSGRLLIWIPVSLLLAAGFLAAGKSIWSDPAASIGSSAFLLISFSLLRSFLCLSVLMAFTAFARRYGSSPSAFNRNLAANSYNIYLVHLVFMVMFQHILMVWPGGPPLVKVGIVFLVTLSISYGISRLIDRFPRGFAGFLICIFLLVMLASL